MQPNANSLRFIASSQVISISLVPECGCHIRPELAEKAKALPPGPFRVFVGHRDGSVRMSRPMSEDARARRWLRKFHGIYLEGK